MTEPRRATTAAWSWLLVLGLLVAQALGLAHRIGHGPALHAAAFVAGQAQDRAQDRAPQRLGADAFGAHEPGSAECRLIDQAGHAEALVIAGLPALPPRPLELAATPPHCAAATAPIRAYLARGPPLGSPSPQRHA